VLAIGLGGILRRCRGTWRRDGGKWGGPGLYPWLAAVTVLGMPVLTADYSERYVLIAVPLACLAAGLAFTRAPVPTGPAAGNGSGTAATGPVTAGLPVERAGAGRHQPGLGELLRSGFLDGRRPLAIQSLSVQEAGQVMAESLVPNFLRPRAASPLLPLAAGERCARVAPRRPKWESPVCSVGALVIWPAG
jgi:hypothetical protein